MKNLVQKFFKEEEGQALTEYGLIIGLVAVACIAALVLLGTQLKAYFVKILDAMGADTSDL